MTTLSPGQVENIEPAWYVGTTAQPTTTATLTLREWSTGAARYWTGTAWSSTVTTLTFTAGNYRLTVPSSWLGLVVEVICSLAGQPDLCDELVIDATVASRATPADVHVNVTSPHQYGGTLSNV